MLATMNFIQRIHEVKSEALRLSERTGPQERLSSLSGTQVTTYFSVATSTLLRGGVARMWLLLLK